MEKNTFPRLIKIEGTKMIVNITYFGVHILRGGEDEYNYIYDLVIYPFLWKFTYFVGGSYFFLV